MKPCLFTLMTLLIAGPALAGGLECDAAKSQIASAFGGTFVRANLVIINRNTATCQVVARKSGKTCTGNVLVTFKKDSLDVERVKLGGKETCK